MPRAFAPSLLALLALSLSCSSSSSSSGANGDAGDTGNAGDTPAGVAADKACADAIAALCAETQTCSPFLFDFLYGDAATCTARLGIGCVATFSTNGNKATPDQLDACAGAIPSASCAEFLGGLNGTGLRNSLASESACAPVAGTLANGSACAGDAQCQSALCAVDPSSFCGTCATPPKAGEACASGACDTGLVCNGSGKCSKPGNAGDACSADAPCIATLGCFGGKCTAGGKEGDACDYATASPTAPLCDTFAGLGCKLTVPPTSTVGTCAKVHEAHAGDACNPLELVVCVGGAWCKGFDPKTPTSDGTCAPPAADGAACDPTAGPPCKPGAKCIGKVCKTPDPTSCK